MPKKVLLTKIILPGPYEILLDPPLEYRMGEKVPFWLDLAGRPVVHVQGLKWVEVDLDA